MLENTLGNICACMPSMHPGNACYSHSMSHQLDARPNARLTAGELTFSCVLRIDEVVAICFPIQ
jgi:hypothetical protein